MRRQRENALLPMWARELFGGLCPPVLNRWIQMKYWEQMMLLKKKRANARTAPR
jgi:hypothetical protein